MNLDRLWRLNTIQGWLLAILAALLVFMAAQAIFAPTSASVTTTTTLAPGLYWQPPPAGVEHHGELVCGGCDFRGVRNTQGGYPAQPNYDFGAGSAGLRGDVVVNWDIGNRTLIYDGRKHKIAAFGPRGIRFYRHPVWPHRRRR